MLIFRCSMNLVWSSTINKCSCPPEWLVGPNNQCYFKSNAAKSWDDAELDCMSKNSHLISINSQEEFDYLASIISNFPIRVNKIKFLPSF